MPIPELPSLKLPSLNLPHIRSMPSIPGVGCVPSDGHSYLGEQFGNLPDMQTLLHVKHLKARVAEEIEMLIEGYLPSAARAPLWAARVAKLTEYIAELNEVLSETVGRAAAEINATLSFISSKQAELNSALNQIQAVPEAARSATQRLMAQRYNEYLGELDAQATRLQATIACFSS